jgi:hypothetical protein
LQPLFTNCIFLQSHHLISQKLIQNLGYQAFWKTMNSILFYDGILINLKVLIML